MRQVDHIPVKPEVHCRDRRTGQPLVGDRHQIGHEAGRRLPRHRQNRRGTGDPFGATDHAPHQAVARALKRRNAPSRLHCGASRPQPRHQPLAKQHSQRLQRHIHICRLMVRQKTIHGHFAGGRHAHQIDRFAQRAFQHRLPEESDHALRLADRFQPRPAGLRHRGVGIPQPGQPQHAPAQLRLLAPRKVLHALQQRCQMQGCRQPGRGGAVGTGAIGADEPERAVAAEAIGQPCATAEVEKVGATSHRHMLAGVDQPRSLWVVE